MEKKIYIYIDFYMYTYACIYIHLNPSKHLFKILTFCIATQVLKVLKLIKDTGKSKMGSKINDRHPSKIL